MILVLIMALVALFFLIAAQPEGEVSALPTLKINTGNNPTALSQVGLENAQSEPLMANPVRRSISPVFTDEVRYWESNILRWAEEFDLDPNLVAIIMQVESCGDPQAVSYAGAQGLFQVMPFHFVEGEDSLDPDTNARRGINYFVGRLEQTGGDIGRSYAGYNGGHVAAASHWDEWAHETQRYYIWTTGLYDDIQSDLTESPTLQQWLQAGGASLCRQAADRLGI
jgi:soluble lytic murein transglycosylase-like protein